MSIQTQKYGRFLWHLDCCCWIHPSPPAGYYLPFYTGFHLFTVFTDWFIAGWGSRFNLIFPIISVKCIFFSPPSGRWTRVSLKFWLKRISFLFHTSSAWNIDAVPKCLTGWRTWLKCFTSFHHLVFFFNEFLKSNIRFWLWINKWTPPCCRAVVTCSRISCRLS